MELEHIGLFEGIGGFSLAAHWAGWKTRAWCEWNEFGQRVLRYHFPEAEGYGDITKTDFKKYNGKIDIITGGFPCQPYSVAGKRKGKEDERHLWPEMLRTIREVQPPFVVGENVFGLINWNGGLVFDEVQADLEAEGFEVWAYVLPACAVNAPHRRDRVWFVAYSHSNGQRRNKNRAEGFKFGEWWQAFGEFNGNGSKGIFTDTVLFRQAEHEKQTAGIEQCDKGVFMHTNSTGEQRQYFGQTRQGKPNGSDCGNGINNFQDFPTQPPICGGDDGLPSELDGITFPKWRTESIKAYGNAIVPQVAYEIFKAINKMCDGVAF